MNKGIPGKRVLLAIPTITSYHTFLKDLIEALLEKGWDAHLACSLQPIQGLDSYENKVLCASYNVEFPRGANFLAHLRAARQLRELVRRLSPEILHCHFSVSAFTAALGHRRDWPYTMATIQGLTFPQMSGFRRRVFALCEGWASRRMDATWVLTPCDQQAFASIGIATNVFVQRTPGFGCRLNEFDLKLYSDEVQLETRKALGFGAADFVFTFVGRQVHFKGFGDVVRAFMRLAYRYANVRLLLIGNRDPLHSTGLTVDEERAMESCSSIRSVGWVSNVAHYLAIADANVFPSKREGMPVNLMESLAMGVPVITADSRGCRDVVRDGIDGIVLRSTSESALENAMETLSQDRDLRNRLSANAIAGRSRFDRRNWIAEQIEIYGPVSDRKYRQRNVLAA